jgi:hypothetical protein
MARIFNNNVTLDTNSVIEYIKREIGDYVPYLGIGKGALGGDDSIYLAIALNPKSEWKNGIFENSQYFRMAVYHSGEMEVFTQSLYKKGQRNCYEGRLKTKFRKCTAKSVEDVVKRIKTFVDKVNAEINLD